jgi:hypothetical protein
MNLESYLKGIFGEDVHLIDKEEIGREETIKDFGYGKPYLIRFKRDGETGNVVLSTMKGTVLATITSLTVLKRFYGSIIPLIGFQSM